MGEPIVVTDEQIFSFLKYLIDIIPTLYVDDNGYPHKKIDGENIYVAASKNSKIMKPVTLYGSPAATSSTEVTILNPFVESLSKSAEQEWFFTVITVGASNYVRWIQKALLMHALISKDKKKEPNPDLELAAILSLYIDKIDEQTIKEFTALTSKMTDYFNIYYLSKKREARIRCGLLDDEDFKLAHKKVRTKTWDVLTSMTKKMFDTKDFSEYAIISKMQGCPQFDATLRILLKIYTMLNRFFTYLPDEAKEDMKFNEIDIDYISRCIDQLDLFRAKAKYIVPMLNNNNTVTTGVNPLNNIQPSIGIPGTQMNTLGTQFTLPGQTNLNTGFGIGPIQPQPPFAVGFSTAFANVGIPGNNINNGFQVGIPGTPSPINDKQGNPYVNIGPFG